MKTKSAMYIVFGACDYHMIKQPQLYNSHTVALAPISSNNGSTKQNNCNKIIIVNNTE